VARLSLNIETTQMGNNKMELMAETKLLNYNVEKSCYIVFGTKTVRNEIINKLKTTNSLWNRHGPGGAGQVSW
jgi:hypothetical protein